MSLYTAMLLGAVIAAPAPSTRIYQNYTLGLSFEYPSSWKAQNKKVSTVFIVPLDGARTAKLEIFEVSFRRPVALWQETVQAMNSAMERKVERQWQERLLGVPLLMSEVSYADKDRQMMALSGLLYTATEQKFQFRLESEKEIYAEAERAWRSVMASVRTLDNQLPTAEDPSLVPEPDLTPKKKKSRKEIEAEKALIKKPDLGLRPQSVTRLTATAGESTSKRAPVAVAVRAALRDLMLFIPKEWSAEGSESFYRLQHPKLKGTAMVEILSQLDSGTAEKSLIASGNKSLEKMSRVDRREEAPARRNRGGAMVRSILRIGPVQGGQLASFDAVGETGNFYWLLTYQGTPEQYKNDKDLLALFVDQASVELLQ